MGSRTHLVPALLLAALSTAPALAALSGGSRYAGATSDGHSDTLTLSPNAKRIKRFRIHYAVKCDDGVNRTTYTDVVGVTLRKDHSFWRSGTYTGSADGSKNDFIVSGIVYAKKARGKFKLSATATLSDGTPVNCKTGQLTWSAKRQK